ncbi:hypothetical protein [Hyphomicrobium methylovorum]|uniref:hypothetical protein n=1 Tax=Hyphomicrobium methylovorum TaxID=84 RepID=UPI0015E724E7|nr:hypothetical protein [Hyphomicrobium methylovorum]
MTTLKNAPCSDVKASSLRQRHGRYRVRLTKSADKKTGCQCFVLKHRGKALTLRQWALHGQAGLTPTQIWRFILMGFPIDEALWRAGSGRAGRRVCRHQASAVNSQERTLIEKEKTNYCTSNNGQYELPLPIIVTQITLYCTIHAQKALLESRVANKSLASCDLRIWNKPLYLSHSQITP